MQLPVYEFPPYSCKLKTPETANYLSLAALMFPLLLTGYITPAKQVPTPSEAVKIAEFETDEYKAQKDLSIIKASTLYALGGTGQGVTVAVIDSGLNATL